MFTKFIFAKNFTEMHISADLLINKKFKIKREENNFILLRKNNYGNIFIHIAFLLVALFYYPYAIFVNLIYFLYNFYSNSVIIFITTETKDKEGNNLIFSDLNDIEEFNEISNENRDILEDVKNVIRKSRK